MLQRVFSKRVDISEKVKWPQWNISYTLMWSGKTIPSTVTTVLQAVQGKPMAQNRAQHHST